MNEKFNPETGQYEYVEEVVNALGADDEQPTQALTTPSAAVTGQLVAQTKWVTWGLIALVALITWPQIKRSIGKVTRW